MIGAPKGRDPRQLPVGGRRQTNRCRAITDRSRDEREQQAFHHFHFETSNVSREASPPAQQASTSLVAKHLLLSVLGERAGFATRRRIKSRDQECLGGGDSGFVTNDNSWDFPPVDAFTCRAVAAFGSRGTMHDQLSLRVDLRECNSPVVSFFVVTNLVDRRPCPGTFLSCLQNCERPGAQVATDSGVPTRDTRPALSSPSSTLAGLSVAVEPSFQTKDANAPRMKSGCVPAR